MSQVSGLANWFLRLPLTWATLATLAFYAALQAGVGTSPFVSRYFDSHLVERVATLLFAVGAVALVMRLTGLLGQFSVLGSDPLGRKPSGGQPVADCGTLLERLATLPSHVRSTYLISRLDAALTYLREVDSADAIEDQLDRLHEEALDRMHGGYATPRLMRATLPIVGMLGTVIGITMAIGQLSPDALEESLTSVMAALSVAFDTTAQAMSLMLALWFAMFGVERVEQRLLDAVHAEVKQTLVGRFQQYGAGTDPNVATIRRMGEQVVGAVEQLTVQHASAWRTAIDATHDRWTGAMADAGRLMTDTLRQGLADNLTLHAEGLAKHAEHLAGGADKQLERIADAVSEQTASIDTATRARLQKLTDIEERHTARLSEASDAHAHQLSSGADNLLGNLREGLERMAELLVEALQKHGETLTLAEGELASENRRHLTEVEAALGESMVVAADRQEKLIGQSEHLLKDMQEALVAAADSTVKHQQELVRQGDVLLRVVESTTQVQQLEDSLNRNLQSLGRTHNFEETLMSLSAAIQLLSARVGAPKPTDHRGPSSHAA
ncbi:MAG: MotA/TolQ/ExbB proton channel family protein [Planctomycetota bacterium]